MKVDLLKNLEYYKSDKSVPCDCEVCKIFYNNVKNKYPKIAAYLEELNVDILRPFELIWVENEEDKTIEYESCQYIVFGQCNEDFKFNLDEIMFENNIGFHPSTEHINGKHFVLDFGKIILPNTLK